MPNQVKLKKQRGKVDLELLQDYIQEAIQSVPSASTSEAVSGYVQVSGPNYLVQSTDTFIACDATNNAITIYLPPAKSVPEQELVIVDRTGKAGTPYQIHVLVGLGIDIIGSAQVLPISTPYAGIRLKSDGVSRWMGW